MIAPDLLAVALSGAGARTFEDSAEILATASAVCAEIARGADIEAACAAGIVSPDVFLGWTVDLEDVAALYARALRVRSRLLRDTPLRLARALADRREGRTIGAASLGEYARAVQVENQLVGALADRGEPPEIPPERRETVVRVQFEPLPQWGASGGSIASASDNETDARELPTSSVTRELPAVYVIEDGASDA